MISLMSNTSAMCWSGAHFVQLESNKKSSGSLKVSTLKNEFAGKQVAFGAQKSSTTWRPNHRSFSSVSAKRTILEFPERRWWEKDIKPNMIDIESEEELIHTLKNAGDKLVIVYFYKLYDSNCRMMHHEICKIAELNPDVTFLRVDYDELKDTCLQIRAIVRPLFWFFRGAEGRIATVYCTIETIDKFYEALEKCKAERCSLGPAKGLGEYEMKCLASDPVARMSLLRAMHYNFLAGDAEI